MTWPLEYQKACVDFERFMTASRDAAGLQTTNMAWTMVEGVFRAFRRRLTAEQAVAFAAALPPLIRAMFLEGWSPRDQPVPFVPLSELSAEVQSLRPQHNFSPSDSVRAVGAALRISIGNASLDRALSSLPPPAREFWSDRGSLFSSGTD
jgi:uncharacterized protein (DUF2267 family)